MKALTIGTFGIPHLGHAAFLRACESFGALTVGVNSDAFVTAYKGSPPLFDQYERMALIRSLGYRVLLNDGPGRELIRRELPDVLVIGSDWLQRDYHQQIAFSPAEFEELSITLVYVPMRPVGISSTEVLRRCQLTASPVSLTSLTT